MKNGPAVFSQGRKKRNAERLFFALAAFTLAISAATFLALAPDARHTLALAHKNLLVNYPTTISSSATPKKAPRVRLDNCQFMASKSSLKILGVSYEAIVSNPAVVKSIIVCNKSDKNCDATVRIRRGKDSYLLATRGLKPGESCCLIEGDPTSISLEGMDVLEARATEPFLIDLLCSYEETSGVGGLFNSKSWNNREDWASSRGLKVESKDPPELVRRALDEGAWRWRNSCSYKMWVYEGVKSMLSGWEGLEMERYTEISSDNGYLASCSANLHVRATGVINAVSFRLQVNSFYFSKLTPEEWGDVITHQMGHALGLGIFWMSPLTFLSKEHFPYLQSSYNSLTSKEHDKTPLEDLKCMDSPSVHWADSPSVFEGVSYCGLENEIMGGRHSSKKMFISELSLAALKDFGYKVRMRAEGVPDLVAVARQDDNTRSLKCGLSSKSSGKMMRMLEFHTLASEGKLSLNKYILS